MSLRQKVNNAIRERRRQEKLRRRRRRTTGQRPDEDGFYTQTSNRPNRPRRQTVRSGRQVKKADRRRQSSPPAPLNEDGQRVYHGRGVVGR